MVSTLLRHAALLSMLVACAGPTEPEPQEAAVVHLLDVLRPPSGDVIDTHRVPHGKASVPALAVTTPSTLRASVRVPADGRLDLSLGVPPEGGPVTFRARAERPNGSDTLLFEVTVTEAWQGRGASLTQLAGQEVVLVFEATSETPDAVGLWGAPLLSGERPRELPNILFYVIDGGGADLMSLYGYERPTTPYLTELASEGIVFEQARTSSAWTKPSTASFMTSLHHSVLGGFTKNEDRIPDEAVTMAEHFRAGGYQTAVFTSNPFAGSMSGLDAGVDYFRDHGAKVNSASSLELHADFWHWREQWPGGPWWVHIQTTDVHEPHHPSPPQAGLYASEERRAKFDMWWEGVHQVQGVDRDTVLGRYQARLEQMGVNPRDFFRAQWDLYDETMTHNDASLRGLVEQLKVRGEWENTLLIVAADHGHPAGSFSRFGRGLIEPPPEDWEGALADSYRTHVPLVFIWPGRLEPGRRVTEPVSMIDLLPTVLELTGLGPAELQQGRSLKPLLTGEGTWETRPLVIEQVQAYEPTGEMVGHIELIDGRWAASLEVMPDSLDETFRATESLPTAGGWRAARPHRPSTPRLLLYDLERDPFCLTHVNAEHPQLVADYTAQLDRRWAEHQALAERFEPAEDVDAGAAQVEALRVLGYVE